MKTILTLLMLSLTLSLLAQESKPNKNANAQGVLIFGFLNGGGALIGMDAELMLKDSKVALIGGIGFKAWGTGIAYHFRPTVNSGSINFIYAHQGLNDSYVASYVGPTYAIKIFNFFAFQIGIGKVIAKGPLFQYVFDLTPSNDYPLTLLFSAGICRFGKQKKNTK